MSIGSTGVDGPVTRSVNPRGKRPLDQSAIAQDPDSSSSFGLSNSSEHANAIKEAYGFIDLSLEDQM